MKDCLGSGGKAPRILDLCTRWMWVVSRPGRFTPSESSWYPLHKRLGGLQSRSGHGGEEKCVKENAVLSERV